MRFKLLSKVFKMFDFLFFFPKDLFFIVQRSSKYCDGENALFPAPSEWRLKFARIFPGGILALKYQKLPKANTWLSSCGQKKLCSVLLYSCPCLCLHVCVCNVQV